MKKLLVIGDIIKDVYVPVSVERRAQEANIPIFDVRGEKRIALGGAANVAANAAALSDNEIEVSLFGLFDEQIRQLAFIENVKPLPVFCGSLIEKHRFVDDNKILARVDNKKTLSDCAIETINELVRCIDFKKYDLILISDYDKGTITQKVIDLVKESGIRTIVDSKRHDLRPFEGAFALKINKEEYSTQVSNKLYTNVESMFENVIVTLGKDGCTLRIFDAAISDEKKFVVHSEMFEGIEVDEVDVTGCGDTHAAAFAIGLLRDPNDVRNAIRFANSCAAIAVQKFGTSKVTRWEYLKTLKQD